MTTKETLEIVIPGLKQLNNGNHLTGFLWLFGAFIGYMAGFIPGLIIHWIYICKYFGHIVYSTYSPQKTQPIFARKCKRCSNNLTVMEKKDAICGKCNLATKGLLNKNEQVLFYQSASYKGGIKGYVDNAEENYKQSGFAFVLEHYFAFYNNTISWKIPYKSISEAKLDFFQLGGVRGFLALGDVGRQLQQTKNILELTYLDNEGVERNARFQIHGALSIGGEEVKAREFLNHLLEFKGDFLNKNSGSQVASNLSDPISQLEKLKKLLDREVITQTEFEAKKREILNKI